MTVSEILIGAGTGLTLIALFGLGICVFKALAVRRGDHPEDGQQVLQKLAALNMLSVAVAFIGLGMVIFGIIL